MKICKTCKKEKSLEDYCRIIRNDKFYFKGSCRNCLAGKIREKRKSNPKQLDYDRKQSLAYYQSHKSERLQYAIKNKKIYKAKDPLKFAFRKKLYAAKIYKKEFKLSFEKFKELRAQKNCFYCEEPLKKVTIDRVDNSIGYLDTNVVASCWYCNNLKSNHNLTKKDLEKILNTLKEINTFKNHKMTLFIRKVPLAMQ